MCDKFIRWFTLIGWLFLMVGVEAAYATHIRAGEIIAERISVTSITYRFTIIGYTDEESPVRFGNGILKFGDGREVLLSPDQFKHTYISDKVGKNTFSIDHTFQAPGQYTISYEERNRNAGVLTMSNSVNTPFYVETVLVIDPSIGTNNTPVLLIPPVDRATTDHVFFHNPGAYDVDGDSLAFRLVPNKQAVNATVDDFREPNNPQYYNNYNTGNSAGDGPPVYSLDPFTGDLVWDAPGSCGEYNTAFVIEEWRKINGFWFFLGYVTRDMQIIVECNENDPPELETPNDTCVVAGSVLEKVITATDPDHDNVQLEAYGGIFKYGISKAVFFPFPVILQPTFPDPARLFFRWQTDCSYIRERPYKVWFKVSDPSSVNDPSLATFKEWNITVVGPAPEGVTAENMSGKRILLSWDAYSCKNASKIQVWRRKNEYEFTPDNCQTGIPGNAGYELVGEVKVDQTTFVDDNKGKGLEVGSNYCYRLVAVFPQPAGGESYASEEVCAELKIVAPLITHVDVEKTSEQEGEVIVKWIAPFEIDKEKFPPPYTYEVGRAVGFSGITEFEYLGKTKDSSFVDTGLNTRDKVYNYRIYLYDSSDNLVDSSAVASTVRGETTSKVEEIVLSWQASVPWSNQVQEHPWHLIYRNNLNAADKEAMILYDSVQVTQEGMIYSDDGKDDEVLSSEVEYCYFIVTRGAYNQEEIESPLINRSQIFCAKPNDTIPPCDPFNVEVSNLQMNECEEFLADKPCDFKDFFNVISWQSPVVSGGCEKDDIGFYEVFYASEGQGGKFVKIAEVSAQDTSFTHTGLESFKGCYKIRAVDRSGNISEFSAPSCIDNCPFYELPNVFTPNGDGINDTFQAFDTPLSKCPRFVKSVEIKFYNRWGKEVHVYNSGEEEENREFINWNGRDKSGNLLSSGIYYYVAHVTFDVLNPEASQIEFKGWVHLMY